ncbi:XTP/dITP diphosphatase [Desulfovibrio litoralis]|uniref:dITP/XTP pyrophosphatase n=1 Tax=Desulfovibrio litoralis DSM 11393 TaxID=1121455 RepID=A0A1M7S8A5_9BACT|nr:XTP/dITP diphosphatase [Desulfovibrio litoralis]SHN54857.1 XTP/dITP diphosphohydrolase [Desulfovibrio litoralis DSM 11393]
MKQKIVLASHNKNKISEFKQMFQNTDFELVGLDEFPDLPEVEETGTSFEENAKLKSRAVAKYTGLIALADDSGISVKALNGAPGVYSARYSAENGQPATTEKNNAKLLSALKGLKGKDRAACFVCVISVTTPKGDEMLVRGEWEGQILETPQGSNGFGYDPLMYISECGCSAAELSADQKNAISHRGKALNLFKEQWNAFAQKHLKK